MKVIKFLSCVLLFPLLLIGQIPNGNFETWPDTLLESPYLQELEWRGALHPEMAIPENWKAHEVSFGVCRVENSCEGDYALLLFSWYHGEQSFLQQNFLLDSRPTSIQGCFKYLHIDTSHFEKAERFAQAILWNGGDTIGQAYFEFDTTSVYHDFEIPINYTSNLVPDSMSLLFQSDTYGTPFFPSDGLMYLDDLKLDYTITETEDILPENNFKIYPNPFENSFYIDCKREGSFQYELYQLNGELVQKDTLRSKTNSLTVAHLPKGVYILNIIGAQRQQLVQKFIKN